MTNQVLVHPTSHPSRTLNISQETWDAAELAAEEGTPNPFILCDDEVHAIQEGKTFDQLTKAEQNKVTKTQEDRQKAIDGAAEEKEEAAE